MIERVINWMEMLSYRRRLLDDYFLSHGGDMDFAIRAYRAENASHRLMRVTEIITSLYWRLAFGVEALECPACEQLTINAWHEVDVWNCRPCCLADAKFDAWAESQEGE